MYGTNGGYYTSQWRFFLREAVLKYTIIENKKKIPISSLTVGSIFFHVFVNGVHFI